MKKLPSFLFWFKNFYVFTGTLALVWVLFLDKYNLISQFKQYRRVKALQHELDYCLSEKSKIAAMGVLDENNMEEIERYSREKHWMKKDDEDLFIVVRK